MKVVITGGAGFIGGHFVRQIADQNSTNQVSKIIVIESLTYASNLKFIFDLIDSKQIEFLQADICDAEKIKTAITDCDLLVNFAAESHVDNSIGNSSPFIKTNILGVENLLRLALENNVKRFVQISTDEVYGSIPIGEATESAVLDPSSPYSASKASADLLVLSYGKTHKLNVLVTRSCNNFGINQHREKFIPKTIVAALRNENIVVYGDGRNIREWINVQDNCRAIMNLIADTGSTGVFNLSSGLRLSNLEVVERVLKLVPTSTSNIEFVSDRKGHDFRYAIKSSRINNKFEYSSSQFNLDLIKTIDWYRKNAN